MLLILIPCGQDPLARGIQSMQVGEAGRETGRQRLPKWKEEEVK